MLRKCWIDETGAIVSAEMVLAGTILVIGILSGLTSLRDAAVTELADLGAAIAYLDQSYVFGGIKAHHVATYGAQFTDQHDFCDQADGAFQNNRCMVLCDPGGGECSH